MSKRRYWLIDNWGPFHCVLMPDGSTDGEVKDKAVAETQIVPGCVVDPPITPREHIARIQMSRVEPD